MNEPIIYSLDRLCSDIPINFEVLGDLMNRLEILESAQRYHQLETKPAMDAVSELCVGVKYLMERQSTRVAHGQEQTTAQQPAKQEDTQSTDDGDRNTTEQMALRNPRFTAINPDNKEYHMPPSSGL